MPPSHFTFVLFQVNTVRLDLLGQPALISIELFFFFSGHFWGYIPKLFEATIIEKPFVWHTGHTDC